MAVGYFVVYLASMFYIFCGAEIRVLGQQQNIIIGSTLNTSAESKWVSPSGEFALGFFKTTANLYLVGVWFDNIPTKTVVWIANRDDPVEEGSTLQLSNRGLQISQSGTTTLKSIVDVDPQIAHTAAMRDDGNFVMLNNSSRILWESFGHPTDTLLPGQVFQSESTLFSKYTDTNYSTGRFMLSLQQGNLMLSSLDRRLQSYWSVQTPIVSNPANLTFDTNGLLSLVGTSSNYTVIWNATTIAPSVSKKVTLDEDGVLRGYIWIGGGANFWRADWAKPDDPCGVHDRCGILGVCDLSINKSTECTCPLGFSFIDNDKQFMGCVRNVPQQSCSAKSWMEGIGDTDWAGKSIGGIHNISGTACQQACLDDCNCTAAVYEISKANCWKKGMPLRDGHRGFEGQTFVKLFDSPQASKEQGGRKKKKEWVLPAIGISMLGCSAILAIFSVIVCLHGSSRQLKTGQEQHEFARVLRSFRYIELEKATSYFQEELGRGASGKVYKGTLPDGRVVAVKKLNEIHSENQEMSDKEFRTELSIIAACHHKNLVQLYGFCDEGSERLLVYEFMSNGSVDKALFGDSGYLDWKLRVQIVLGTARGILYLHQECKTQILHCDIKPQNILLDENYEAQISDFGIAKLIGAEQTRAFTVARGTIGYIAPEWQRNMGITAKVDVYSFGVMLLEIICYRKMVELNRPENEIILCDWIYDCIKDVGLEILVEQQQTVNQESIDTKEVERMVLVGLWCIQEDPFLRPSIKTVVQMLEGTVEMPVPPRPGTCLERPELPEFLIL